MRTPLSALVLLTASWGCGGNYLGTVDAGSDGGTSVHSDAGLDSAAPATDSGEGVDASGGTGGGPCPSSLPATGSACTPPGLACEYGADPNPDCNQQLDCTASGWASLPQVTTCLPGTCPATYADVPQSKVCSPGGLDCSYAQGQCNCYLSLLVGTSPLWQCTTPASGCPEPRPRIGDPCTQPGFSCDYGACTGGVSLQCINGNWQSVLGPCPS